MTSLGRQFKNHEAAMEAYREQLSRGELFVECFEVLSPQSQVQLTLRIIDSAKQILLPAKVLRMVGKSEAVGSGFGSRPGVLLSVPITAENRDALIAFFSAPAKEPPKAQTQSPVPNQEAKSQPGASSLWHAKILQGADKLGYYALFDLSAGASISEIRAHYHERVRSFHPDNYDEALDAELEQSMEEAYQQLNEAYETLSNPIKRKIYDKISAQLRCTYGASFGQITAFWEEYRRSNAAGIRRADSLWQEAQSALESGDQKQAEKLLKLALSFDALHYDSLFGLEDLKD